MTVTSDFTLDSRPAQLLRDPRVGVGFAIFSTFALGFTEASLTMKCRPIPLRFALRFAAVNVLPSVVWRSISARYVAAASGVALSGLLTTEKLGNCSTTTGKRLVLMKSVRALRMTIGSYGLALSLWRYHNSIENSYYNNNNKESVVRFAPMNSPLSCVSRRQHADHILTVSRIKENWKKQPLDWNKVGINVKNQLNGQEDEIRMKVIEVEIHDPEKTMAYTQQLKAQAVANDNASLCLVAVLPLCGQPLLTSIIDAFDIYFNPLSAVLTFIASTCHDRGVAHSFLIADQNRNDESDKVKNGRDNDINRHLSTSQIAAGLLSRHGITTRVLHEKTLDEVNLSGVVFVIAKNLRAGQLRARNLIEQGIFKQEEICFILEDSLCGQGAITEARQAQSALLQKAISFDTKPEREVKTNNNQEKTTYMSVADVSDQTLQGIRMLLRKGEKPDAIQAALYQAYGTQRVAAPSRCDQFSDMHI